MKSLMIILFVAAHFTVFDTPHTDDVIADAVQWEKTQLELGEIPQGVPKQLSFIATNNGDSPFLIKEVRAGCGCTSTKYSKEPVVPGTTTEITAEFNAKKAGPFTKQIKVYTSISEEPQVLTFTGTVVEKP